MTKRKSTAEWTQPKISGIIKEVDNKNYIEADMTNKITSGRMFNNYTYQKSR